MHMDIWIVGQNVAEFDLPEIANVGYPPIDGLLLKV